jgi:hypothetical protein
MTLADAQICIADDWHACARQISRERAWRHH